MEKLKIGQRIKERRKELKMSADELGRKLGKDRSTIYRYENGDIENMPLDILPELASALEMTQQELMGWENIQKNNDIVSDIIVRMRKDPEFLSFIIDINSLDNEKFNGVKQMLSAFIK